LLIRFQPAEKKAENITGNGVKRVFDFRGRVPEKLQQSVISVKDLGFHFQKAS
jgi:hypothetical protein